MFSPHPFIRRISSRRLLIAAALVMAVTTSTGCITEPTMKLYSAAIRGGNTQGVQMNITMTVRNDNSFDIMVRNVTVNVTLAGRHRLPTVVHAPNTWLPADKTTLVSVPVVVPWNQVAPILATTALTPEVTYHAVGNADVTATRALEIDVNAYELSEEGTFSRSDLVAAALRGAPGVQINVQSIR